MAPDDPDSEIRKVARAWILRLAAGEVDERSLGALKHWRRIDIRNNAAFETERRIYRSLQPFDLAFAQDGPALPHRSRAKSKKIMVRASAAAASAAAVALAWWMVDPMVALQADKATGIGEIASVTLPDGSTATLDSDSALAVDFDSNFRRVHLLRGEAWFKVRHDVAHPFLVDSDGATARAVGTAFAVRSTNEDKTSLAVTEGRVRFSDRTGRSIEVVAGQGAVVSTSAPGPQLTQTNINGDLAWRFGRVTFENRTLAEVATLLNRYRRGRILVMGSAARRRVSGVLSVGAIDEGLAGLAAAQGLRVTHITPWLIILR